MKRVRVFVLTVLVLILAPSAFAQFCQSCDWQGYCAWDDSGKWCIQGIDYCTDYHGCSGRSATVDAPSIASQYSLASVEVVTPAETQVTEVAASVRTAELEQQQKK
jgi:hypothetical protein